MSTESLPHAALEEIRAHLFGPPEPEPEPEVPTPLDTSVAEYHLSDEARALLDEIAAYEPAPERGRNVVPREGNVPPRPTPDAAQRFVGQLFHHPDAEFYP